MGLYEQIKGIESPSLPSHEVGACWRLWVEGTFDNNEMWGDGGSIPPKMAWGAQTRIDLEAQKTRHDGLGQPQQAQYFTLVEGVYVAWISPLNLLTKAQGEAALV